MAKADKQGRRYVKISELTVGQTIWLDGCFPCHPPGQVAPRFDGNRAYFACDEGNHYLDSQCDDGKHCVGIYAKDPGQISWEYLFS